MAKEDGTKIQREMMSSAGNSNFTQNQIQFVFLDGALREGRYIFVTFVPMHSVTNASGGI